MRILITGASGFFGSRLFSELVKNHDIAGTTFTKSKKSKQKLDITDKNSVINYFEELRPELVVHAAAISDANFCEEKNKEADRINIEGTRNIVKACKKYSSKMIFLSSDYVFDGNQEESYNESDNVNPINYYGKTKAEGEKIVMKNLDEYIILRPTILYGYNNKSNKITFVEKIIENLKQGKEIKADNIVSKYPLLIDDLAQVVKILIEKKEKGIFNILS